MDAHERRTAIWNTLCHRRHVTMPELAEKFQVSYGTIQHDVNILSLIHPIVTAQGGGGGVRVAEWYKPSPYAYSPAQMKLLLRLADTLSGEDAAIMLSIIDKHQP